MNKIKDKSTMEWKEHWPAAKECPQCGEAERSFLFRHLCRHSEQHVQAIYDTWLECTSCGRKGRPVSKPFQTWYLDQLCGDDFILIAAIDNWNRDC